MLASYFECYGNNLSTALQLPAHMLHLDLVRCPAQLNDILASSFSKSTLQLSLRVVDGRNIWNNDFEQSLVMIQKAVIPQEQLGSIPMADRRRVAGKKQRRRLLKW